MSYMYITDQVDSSSAMDEAPSEETIEYGPQLPDDYVPPNKEPTSEQDSVGDAPSRKRPVMEDEATENVDDLLDEAMEVKRPRLDEGRLVND